MRPAEESRVPLAVCTRRVAPVYQSCSSTPPWAHGVCLSTHHMLINAESLRTVRRVSLMVHGSTLGEPLYVVEDRQISEVQ